MISKICLKCEMYETRTILNGIKVGCKCKEPQLLTVHDMALPAPDMDARAEGIFQSIRGRALSQIVLNGEMEFSTRITLITILECMGYFFQSIDKIMTQINTEGMALRDSRPFFTQQN